MTQRNAKTVSSLTVPAIASAWPFLGRHIDALVILVCFVCFQPLVAAGQSPAMIDREYPLKAAYLYNFGAYIEWPDDAFEEPTSPLVIGVIGQAPFGDVLDQLSRRNIGSRQVAVRHLGMRDPHDACHILFVAASVSDEQQRQLLAEVRGLPVLCVGEAPGFTEYGGDIGFFVLQNKLRFKINLEAARGQGLKISSKLLSIATVVNR